MYNYSSFSHGIRLRSHAAAAKAAQESSSKSIKHLAFPKAAVRPLQTQPPPAPRRQQRRVPLSPCTKRAIFVQSVHGYKPARARHPGSAAPAAPPHTAPAPVPPCRAAAGTQVRGPWPRAVRPRRRSAQPLRRKTATAKPTPCCEGARPHSGNARRDTDNCRSDPFQSRRDRRASFLLALAVRHQTIPVRS